MRDEPQGHTMLDADCSKLAGIDIEGTAGTRCRMLDTEEIALLGLLLMGTQGHTNRCLKVGTQGDDILLMLWLQHK